MGFTDRIIINPEICAGKPVIKGTRLKVEFILELLAEGWSNDEICKEYDLKKDDILAVLQFAKNLMNQEEIFSFSSE